MYAIPSLQDLTGRARQAIRAYLPGSDAWLWPNNLNVAAKVIAGVVFEVFGFADYIQRQKFALTADRENLILHGQEYGLTIRPAQPARGLLLVTDAGPLTVDNGAIFTRGDGVQVIAVAAAALPGPGTLPVPVEAVVGGKAGNTEGGAAFAVTTGVTGTAPLAMAAPDGIVLGADEEDTETFRARILFRKRNPPHGGAPADYVQWAGEVAGVSVTNGIPDVWVETARSPSNGAGFVRVYFLMRGLYQNGIAPISEVERVADHIETVRPAGAIVTVTAPSPKIIDVQIAGLSPDTITVREAVLAELAAAFERLARVAGNDTPHPGMPYLATPATFSRSWLWQTIANAAGEERHTLNLPAADVTLAAGEIAVLGTVTFIP